MSEQELGSERLPIVGTVFIKSSPETSVLAAAKSKDIKQADLF